MHGPLAGVNWASFAPSLQYIDFAGNLLTGTLPASIGNLSNLTYLRLEFNQFGGPLPAGYFQLHNLSTLSLGQNSLTGTIPSFSGLPNLAVLKLGNNQLNGQLPSDWSASSSLEIFAVEFNRLTGSLPPPGPGNLLAPNHAGLQIKLRNNSLTGSLPAQLSTLPVGVLDFGNNNFTGNLSVLEGMALATEFRFDQNALTGSLPLINHNVQIFHVQSNNLTGTFPVFRSTALIEMRYSYNLGLSGPFPNGSYTPYLLFLRIHATNMSQSLPSQQNSRRENLPESLMFDRNTGLVASQDIENLECLGVIANPQAFYNLQVVLVDSHYFNFQECTCRSGYKFVAGQSGQSARCEAVRAVDVKLIVPTVVLGTLAVGLILVLCGLLLHHKWLPAAVAANKAKGPPVDGKPATLVLTDVEASTELWEWDRLSMMEAIAIHDRIMRSNLRRFQGYEVSTEGDAFLLVFHDPADAIAYTIATQQALHAAPWPYKLEEQMKSCITLRNTSPSQRRNSVSSCPGFPRPVGMDGRSRSEGFGTESDALLYAGITEPQTKWPSFGEINVRDAIYWGLKIRMAVATGTAEDTKMNTASKRREYAGKLKHWVEALSHVLHGGQIIIDSATFAGISQHLTDILKAVPAHPDYKAMEQHQRGAPSYVDPALQDTAASGGADAAALGMTAGDQSSLLLALVGPTRRSNITIVGPNHKDEEEEPARPAVRRPRQLNAQISHRSMADLEEITPSSPRSPGGDDDTTFDGRTWQRPSLVCKAHLSRWQSLWDAGNGAVSRWGRGLAERWGLRSRSRRPAPGPKTVAGEGIMVVDMGTHCLPGLPGAHALMQIAVPGLEERVRFSRPLCSIPLSPGYLDAPGAFDSPLCSTAGCPRRPLQPVTLVFCSIDGLAAMKEASATAAEMALMLYQDYVRRWLLKLSGYECQQADGEFMLAFDMPVNAVKFCLAVQEAMLQGTWSREVLALPNCGAASEHSNHILWYGPRVRMGLYEGEPTCIVPHATSGRADYFGPLVNRAARFCYGAAHGGQIMMPEAMAERIISDWAGEGIDFEALAARVPNGPPASAVPVQAIQALSRHASSLHARRSMVERAPSGWPSHISAMERASSVWGPHGHAMERAQSGWAPHLHLVERAQSGWGPQGGSMERAPSGWVPHGGAVERAQSGFGLHGSTVERVPSGWGPVDPHHLIHTPSGLTPAGSMQLDLEDDSTSSRRRQSHAFRRRSAGPPGHESMDEARPFMHGARESGPRPASTRSSRAHSSSRFMNDAAPDRADTWVAPLHQPSGLWHNSSIDDQHPLHGFSGSGRIDIAAVAGPAAHHQPAPRERPGRSRRNSWNALNRNSSFRAMERTTSTMAGVYPSKRLGKRRSFSAASYLGLPLPSRKSAIQLQRSQSVDLLLEGTYTRSQVSRQAAALRRSSAPISAQQALADQYANAAGRTAANSASEGRPSTSRSRTGLISRRISGSRNSGGSEYGRGGGDDTVPIFEVELHHCGLFHFKGLADLQSVIQVNSVKLAGRTFPAQLPSKKGKLVGPAKGLRCVMVIQ
ncbi:hypothetical protein WJX73_005571 [Symbiochloris irregularis]|uniref:Guanylate cyclase domain-containing protein n=1 Tax=Symbiochloris irregularis TaxID=706552 RepID=A0AAW1NRV0_9CHLO